MRLSWQTETGHVACRWSEIGQRNRKNPDWMQEHSGIQGAYIPPIPDFASHSPFGGPSWFQPRVAERDPE